MKKIFIIFLATVVIASFTLSGCDSKDTSNSASNNHADYKNSGSKIDGDMTLYTENGLFGYENTKTDMRSEAVFVDIWPFIDGIGCGVTEDGDIVALDKEFNVTWNSYSIIDIVAEGSDSAIDSYFLNRDNMKNVYAKKLGEYEAEYKTDFLFYLEKAEEISSLKSEELHNLFMSK